MISIEDEESKSEIAVGVSSQNSGSRAKIRLLGLVVVGVLFHLLRLRRTRRIHGRYKVLRIQTIEKALVISIGSCYVMH